MRVQRASSAQAALLDQTHVLFFRDKSSSTMVYFGYSTGRSQLLGEGSEPAYKTGTKNLQSY